MKVADLFCGCGGFSLGFEYAGFKIVYGLDKWDMACESFSTNFPDAEVVCEDALNLTPDDIPDVDVIIGGPPCQRFSCANLKKVEDPSLVNWFWRVVEEKQPKYVVMEEVPAARKYVPRKWKVKVFRMCDFGVPQIRKRLFAGNYPDPVPRPTSVVFPAVMATEYKGRGGSRQMTRLSDAFGRKSLIPEAKLVQTFPLDYFLAGTLKDQYIQIGNAVPPAMAYAIAEAIVAAEERQTKLEMVES